MPACQDISRPTTANGIGNTAPTTNRMVCWKPGAAPLLAWPASSAAAVNARPFQLMLSVAAITRAATSSPIGAPTAAAAAGSSERDRNRSQRHDTAAADHVRPASRGHSRPPNPGCRPRREQKSRGCCRPITALDTGTPREPDETDLRRGQQGAAARELQAPHREEGRACVARSGAGCHPSRNSAPLSAAVADTPIPRVPPGPV